MLSILHANCSKYNMKVLIPQPGKEKLILKPKAHNYKTRSPLCHVGNICCYHLSLILIMTQYIALSDLSQSVYIN